MRFLQAAENKKAAFLLDFDELTVDTDVNWPEAISNSIASHPLPQSAGIRIAWALGEIEPGSWKGLSRVLKGIQEILDNTMVEGKALNFVNSGQLYELALKEFYSLVNLKAGVASLLRNARYHGISVGVVTANHRAIVEDRLVQVGIPGVPILFSIEDRMRGLQAKPSPYAWVEACRRLQCHAAICADNSAGNVRGISEHEGEVALLAIGVPDAISIAEGVVYPEHPDCRILRSLEEIGDILEFVQSWANS